MEFHDIEIEISKTGKVHARIEGAKGKACLDYAGLLEKIIGRIEDQQMTSEFYEPDSQVVINTEIHGSQHR